MAKKIYETYFPFRWLIRAGNENAFFLYKLNFMKICFEGCGHCKRMKPEYEKAAVIMKEKKIPGILAAIDATKEKEIGNKFDVKGYPTVKYFSDGEFKFDVNVRDVDKILLFMTNPSEPPKPPPPEVAWEDEETNVVHLDENNFKGYLKKKKHALVMFYATCELIWRIS